MRYVRFMHNDTPMLGLREGEKIRVVGPRTLESLLAEGLDLVEFAKARRGGEEVQAASITQYLPPLSKPGKIFCVGLNYADHTKESAYQQPDYPTIFPRYASSLVGHGAAIVRPKVSDSLDYEGEMAVVLKGGGRHVAKEDALRWVAGYALFNDASVREYQFKSPQWTIGKNFDATGAFGPDLVTPEELPAGGRGLRLQTKLNGQVVQDASTDDMLFDVVTLISILSAAITLEAGDVIVTGTPSGIGWARQPPLIMRAGDVCEVSISGIGTLRNTIEDER